MRTNIAAAAAERDPEAELKTAAEMLLQRGRAFAGSLLTDVSLGPPRQGRPSLRAARVPLALGPRPPRDLCAARAVGTSLNGTVALIRGR